VARSLTEAGFDVWTPVEVQKRRVGREREVKETTLPITPGIVFAREDCLHDLLTLARSPVLTYLAWNPERKRMERHGCPHFSVFRHLGQYPRVADRSLDPLRQAEQRLRPREQGPLLNIGDEVRIPSSAFGGLVGIVKKVQRRVAMVRVKATTGEMLIKVEMCDLLAA
jgi:preprotein translocase subunit YajC